MSEINDLRALYTAAKALRETSPVDDDFPEMMHNFDGCIITVGHSINTHQKIDVDDLQLGLFKWASNQFKGQPISGKFSHLRKEIDELEADQKDIMEYADCYMLLMDIASNNGVLLSDIHSAAERKLEINKKRKWGKQNDDGSVEHVRGDA